MDYHKDWKGQGVIIINVLSLHKIFKVLQTKDVMKVCTCMRMKGQRKGKMKQKQFIILYGNRGQGKTTTLIELVIELGGGSFSLRTDINRVFLDKGRYKDGRFIIEYRNELIYVATAGDTWKISCENIQFFDGSYNGNMDVYLVSAGKLYKLSKSKKDRYRKEQPVVRVCACRPDGDRYGAIKAIHSYSESQLINYSEQLWLRKEKEQDNMTMAKAIKKRIDDFL